MLYSLSIMDNRELMYTKSRANWYQSYLEFVLKTIFSTTNVSKKFVKITFKT